MVKLLILLLSTNFSLACPDYRKLCYRLNASKDNLFSIHFLAIAITAALTNNSGKSDSTKEHEDAYEIPNFE